MHLLLLLFLLLSFIPPAPAGPSTPLPDAEAFIPGELIIGLEAGHSVSALALPTEARPLKETPTLRKLNAAVVQVPPGREEAYLRQLRSLPGVRFVERNGIVRADLIPNDPLWSSQYGPSHVQAPAAWDTTTGSPSVILAIVDSGIDPDHPEFAGRILPGYDFLEGDPIPQDECGHGTHVAGIAAAGGNNSEGIAGIAWNVKILPIRVLGADCNGTFVSVAEGIIGAVERGAKVINLSIGSASNSRLLQEATFYAYTRGAALIAAAGNTNSSVVYPAKYDWVLAVGATDNTDTRTSFSNYGPELDLMAPGKDILSTFPTYSDFLYHDLLGKSPNYDTLSGTSMAAPHVAGAAALLASLPGFDTPDKIYQALTQTALDLDAPGRDDYTGYGLLQIDAALHYSPSILPTPTPSPPTIAYDVLDSPACPGLVSYAWRDTSGGTQLIFVPGSNNGVAALPLPFAFPFGGSSYTTLYVGSNGLLSFDPIPSSDSYLSTNFVIPTNHPNPPHHFIAPFWDDLTLSAGGSAWYAVLGSAPNREVVIEYRNAQRFEGGVVPGEITFQVVLFETSGDILIQYKRLRGAGARGESATIGVEFDSGRSGLLFSYNTSALKEGLALRFVTYFPHLGLPPSALCSVYTRPANSSGGFYEKAPFCLSIPSGALAHPAYVRIQPLSSAPPMPSQYLDLEHYADIRLLYLSPPIPISPLPEAYVCYRYTPADVLRAGGHPENLRIMAYDSRLKRWQALSTSVDSLNSLLFARAPHFSIFGIATFGEPSRLPVTGGSIWWNENTRWAWVPLLGLILFLWLVLRRFGRFSPRS
ncbi:MAG: S8 family peptidase [Anaerolineales bacterium]